MIGLLLAIIGASGVFLLLTTIPSNASGTRRTTDPLGATRTSIDHWLEVLAEGDQRPRDLLAMAGLLVVLGAGLGFALFGGVVPPVLAGMFASSFPFASARFRRETRRREARDAWPRLIEEIRLMTGSLGRSIPQALLEVGRRAPEPLQPAFASAEREWLLTTDFARTVEVLKARLCDPTADATCETLLVAHEIGGADLDRRLAALAEDRQLDLQGRKDALAKQAGVRFARRFVLVVPLGMALAGLSIGTGRSAYGTAAGQILVAFGLVVVALCWVWAGRIMRLPEDERVFS